MIEVDLRDLISLNVTQRVGGLKAAMGEARIEECVDLETERLRRRERERERESE